MTIGQTARHAGRAIKALALAAALLASPQAAFAAPASSEVPDAAAATSDAADAAQAAAPAAAPAAAAPAPAAPKVKYSADHFKVADAPYKPAAPVAGKGQPVPGGMYFQDQYSPSGQYALWMHSSFLLPIITVISLLVLLLLLIVVARFNRRANPVASKTSHNTLLEVIWTAVPILILVVIAVPSIKLIKKQYQPAGDAAVTVKATGYQWYWTYSYPDNGGFEVVSNILKEKDQVEPGQRFRTDADGDKQLAVDNRMVVPVGEPIRFQTIGADVIHSFAVPSLWFKLDAVPGQINERQLVITQPGVYFGQCSELCGVRHGYMPIVIEALPRDQFNRWVIDHGGKIEGAPDAPAAAAAAAPAAAAKPAA